MSSTNGLISQRIGNGAGSMPSRECGAPDVYVTGEPSLFRAGRLVRVFGVVGRVVWVDVNHVDEVYRRAAAIVQDRLEA